MREWRVGIVLLGAALVGGCQGRAIFVLGTPAASAGATAVMAGDGLTDGEVREGFYAYGFETSAFVPCGSKEQWWVIPDTPALADTLIGGYKKIADAPNGRAFARLRGKVTEPGNFGHLGMFQREFRVGEVVELRGFKEGDCG